MRLLLSTSRRQIRILLATGLVAATAAVAGPAVAAHAEQDCTGSSCNGLNSNTAGCVSDAVSRSTPQTFSDNAAGEQLAIQLRGSPSCESRWARVWAFNSSGSQWLPPSGLKFTIYSDNASGKVVYSQTATVGSRGWESNPYWVGPMVSGVSLYSKACFPNGVCTSWWPSPPPNPQPVAPHASPQFNDHYSGYITRWGSYTAAGAIWDVPTLNCRLVNPFPYTGISGASQWVGLGGVSGGIFPGNATPLVQAGIISRCYSLRQVNTPFWEVLPGNLAQSFSGHTVKPGDQILASVIYLGGGKYELDLQDVNKAHSWSAHAHYTVADQREGTTAEWIIEPGKPAAEEFGVKYYTLADFGKVTFNLTSYSTDAHKGILLGGMYSGVPTPLEQGTSHQPEALVSAVSPPGEFNVLYLTKRHVK